jgi:uncharacterized protein YcbK (DUF882 family)
MMNGISSISTNRRTFLKIGVSAILTTTIAQPVWAAVPPIDRHPHVLSLYNIHTGEAMRACYRNAGKLIPGAIQRINHIMRDYRTGEIKPVDPKLLDLLHHIVTVVNPRAPISIISGYRSPRTNAALRKITKGVARKSLHMEGRAIDIRIPGYQTSAIRQLAVRLKSGGVGYYPKSDFIHLDTGPVKTW